MRIVAGAHKGRVLLAPQGRDTRPTSDRTRGAVFNIIAHGLEGFDLHNARVLDVFAGTGALGLEALSRGARHTTFMENHRTALRCLSQNIAALCVEKVTAVLSCDATRPRPASDPCHLVFLDPPYGKSLVPKTLSALVEQGWIAAGALCVAEMGVTEDLETIPGFRHIDHRTYGAAAINFLAHTG